MTNRGTPEAAFHLMAQENLPEPKSAESRSVTAGLVARAQQGDMGAFGELMHRVLPEIRIVVRRVSCPSEVEQETMLVLLRKLGLDPSKPPSRRFEGTSKFRNFASAVANLVKRCYRKRSASRRSRELSLDADASLEQHLVRDDADLVSANWGCVEEELRKLGPDSTLAMHVLESKSQEEIARDLGISINAVRVRMSRERTRVKSELLSAQIIESSS